MSMFYTCSLTNYRGKHPKLALSIPPKDRAIRIRRRLALRVKINYRYLYSSFVLWALYSIDDTTFHITMNSHELPRKIL